MKKKRTVKSKKPPSVSKKAAKKAPPKSVSKKTSRKKVTPQKKGLKKTTVAAKKKPLSEPKALKKTSSPKKTLLVTSSVTPELLSASPSSAKKNDAVRVQAEIVDNSLATRGSTELTPLADGLSAYLANVNKYPLLTREQEQIIAKRYFEEKNPKDAEILVTSNLRFVVKVAAEYSKFGNRLLDVIQEGNVGLMHAVKEFNPYKGVRLITYAVWWIRGYIQEYLMRQHSMVRIGTTQNQRKLFYHLQKEKNLLDLYGQEPTVKLLAAKLGVPENDVRMMEERLSGGDISLDIPVSADNNTPRIQVESDSDSLSVDDELARKESLHMLDDKIQMLRPQLSEKEVLLLEQRLLADEPVTLQDIGEKWGVTREAVRQMESRLIKKIKDEVLKATE
jgi:RNA polymerase sigma-32 factor